jgi:predicted DNA-binding transcriptional regulator AlpA
MENNVVTSEQLQMILGVNESTIKALIRENDFPESVIHKNGCAVHFNLGALLKWFAVMEVQICQC